MDRFEELTSEYLDGVLGAAGREELSSLVQSDPERLRLFVDLVRESRILSTQVAEPDADEFSRGVMADLEKDKTRFIRAVMGDVRRRPPSKRRPGPRPGPGAAWMAWVAAAAAAVVILALVFSGGEDPSPRRERRPGKETPIAEREKATRKEERREEVPVPPRPDPPRPPTPVPEKKTPPALPEVPKPEPEKPGPEPPAPKPPPPEKRSEEKPTVVEVAALGEVEGSVLLERGGERRAARAGEALVAGDVLDAAGDAARAIVRYGDGTTVAVQGETVVRIAAGEAGKRLQVERGVVRAQVTKQPATQPMVFASPHGDAIVLGTTLRLVVGRDPKEGTRLDVEEGKVRLERKGDGKGIDVPSGHFAVAAAGFPLLSRPARVTLGLAALYTFKEGRGVVVRDVSRAGAPLDLRIENESAARWTSKGLALPAPNLVASVGPASRIVRACKTANELTIEAWVRPAVSAPANKDGRIVTLSIDPMGQDFMLGQDELKGPARSYFVRLRTTATDLVGKPALAAPEGNAAVRLTHVVYTRSASGTAILYVDGAEVSRATVAGSFSAWNETYRLALGNELTGDRPWLGEFHLAAVYSRALSADDVKQNQRAGAE